MARASPPWATMISAWWVEARASRNRATHMPLLQFTANNKLHMSMFLDDIASCHAIPDGYVYHVAWHPHCNADRGKYNFELE